MKNSNSDLLSVFPDRGTATRAINVRQASFADYEQIAAVLSANSLNCESREDWKNLWLDNPAYKARQEAWPIGWVLETRDGSIAGTISNIPQTYTLAGKDLVGAVCRGWAVLDQYRASSLLLLGKYVSQPGVDLFLTTTAGVKPAAAFGRLRWSRPPVGQWDRRALWITNHKGFAQSFLRVASVPGAGPLGWLAGPALALVDGLAHWPFPIPSHNFDLRFSSTFDERFDRFWEQLKAARRNVLMAVRSCEALTWQFKAAMKRNLLWIITAHEGERLLGYGIFWRNDKPAEGLKRVRVVDFQALEGHDELCAAILSRALQRCRDEGIHVLEYPGCWLEGASFPRRLAPHHCDLPSWTYFYKTNRKDLKEWLADPACWRPTTLDGDSSF